MQILSILVLVIVTFLTAPADAYEVWLADQSDTGKESGGFLHIYDGAQLAADPSGAKPTVTIDLAGDVNKLCEEATKKPVRRPHMLFFTKDQSHIIVSFLSGHVLFMDAATKKPEACLSMGKNVHAAWPTPNQKMAIAANMADKKFIRIWTDYKDHKFTFDESKDVMALGAMESPERPDTAPVCPITEDSSKFAFITLRGGGLIVTDVTETPMKVLATLDNKQVHPAGCGGATGRPPTPTAWRWLARTCGAAIGPATTSRSLIRSATPASEPSSWPARSAMTRPPT